MQGDERRAVMSDAIGAQICAALGLDPTRVLALRLELAGGEVAQVVVTRLLSHRHGLEVANLLAQRYQLMECGEAVLQRIRPGDNALGEGRS
ncbi:MAG: hypothetical protein AMXMBFR78_11410 [Rubrivivax sp.]|jgi:hypothetical protein